MKGQFMSISEFAKEIGVHPNTLRKWENQKLLLPHHKTPGGRRIYTKEQATEYLTKNNTDNQQ